MKLGLDIYARLEVAGARVFAERVAREHGQDPNDVLVVKSRRRGAVRARDEIVSVVTDTLGLSLPEAGRLFDMDHSSVLTLQRRRAFFLAENTEPPCVSGLSRDGGKRGEMPRERRAT